MINCLQCMTTLGSVVAAGICQLLQNPVDNHQFPRCGDGSASKEARMMEGSCAVKERNIKIAILVHYEDGPAGYSPCGLAAPGIHSFAICEVHSTVSDLDEELLSSGLVEVVDPLGPNASPNIVSRPMFAVIPAVHMLSSEGRR